MAKVKVVMEGTEQDFEESTNLLLKHNWEILSTNCGHNEQGFYYQAILIHEE